jgi:hypothetical protein
MQKKKGGGGNPITTANIVAFNKAKKFKDEDVFVANSTYARHHIKKRIIEDKKIPYCCAVCGIDPIWNGKPMPLILDHINGINDDNRLSNLRFVCSNCDSQLDTYKSRNRGRKQLECVSSRGC